jgi:hypothetical protein
MSTHVLRPWSDCVKLHPDVEAGALTESTFAIDLGAIAAADPNVPAVYRDPASFFRATYLTADLRKLLGEVLGSLAGRSTANRVLKLRTPFGGGKSHTLATLLHAASHRSELDHLPEAAGLAKPGGVAVAVFDGEKFDARVGKNVSGGRTVQTMWGWLAWQISPESAYPLVEGHDRDRVAPGGDVIARLLSEGAGGRPVLVLLDEVLKYMERAAAVPVHDSTLQRQAKDFFQNLTVEVANSRNAVLVYALTWSAREALGNVGLLEEIDKLAARVDQLREPVTGDEVLPILQRRLLGTAPPAASALAVAGAYSQVVAGMQKAYAESDGERRDAEAAGLALRERIRAAYPFHPALIDVMRERWTSVEAFQRTRGALRFLAACLHSLKRTGGAGALLGPGDIPLRDGEVRTRLLNDLGAQYDFDPVLTADLTGPNARARQIDERLARETPALASVRPATRLATIILLCSFGGLKRDAKEASEPLPPGITEADLLLAGVTPELDALTATSVLTELRSSCLYLHYDGARYCFKKDPNVTKLIEDAEQAVSREEAQGKGGGPVRARIKEMLEQRLAKCPAEVWPAKSQDVPDNEPRFVVAYLPLELAAEPKAEQERIAKDYLYRHGERPRNYRNALGLAIPDRKPVESLRRAVRYLLAIDRVKAKKQQHRLTADQLTQLEERRRTEEAAAESALRELYLTVWLPRINRESGGLDIEPVEKGGRPLQATGLHDRVLELLTGQGSPKVHATVTPRKIAERVKLGEVVQEGDPPRRGVRLSDVRDAFFAFPEPPRLTNQDVLRAAVVRGVAEKVFGYLSGEVPKLGPDDRFQVGPDKVRFGTALADDEVDFETGFLVTPAAIPAAPAAGVTPATAGAMSPPDTTGAVAGGAGLGGKGPAANKPGARCEVGLEFVATRGQLFKAFQALANLADKCKDGKLTVRIRGTAASPAGFDLSWLRNAVEEPLDEADIERRDGGE